MSFIELPDQKIYYAEYGDINNPPLIFGHSFLWNSELMWKSQIDYLSDKYYCITIDLVGHGKSSNLPIDSQQYTLSNLADNYYKVIETIGIQNPLIIGLSVGGMWGAHLAVQYPKTVSGLVLMNTDLNIETPTRKAEYLSLIDLIEQKGTTSEMIDKIIPYFFTKNNINNNIEIIKKFKANLTNLSYERIATIVNLGKAIFGRSSLLKELSKLKIPTLIISGAEDIARHPSESEVMANTIPNSQLEIIDKAAHASSVEQPDIINAVIDKFLIERYGMDSNIQ